jgi:hypothetical protein
MCGDDETKKALRPPRTWSRIVGRAPLAQLDRALAI